MSKKKYLLDEFPNPSFAQSNYPLKLKGETHNKVVISQIIDQSKVDLVGGIWTDKEGKIHFAGLIYRDGVMVIDFPQMKDVYIADVAQVGLVKDAT